MLIDCLFWHTEMLMISSHFLHFIYQCYINVIIDKLAFFDLPIKTEEEAYEKIIDIGRNNEYTTGNLLDYAYFKKYYKLIAIDLSKQQVLQENEDLIQQINFTGRLEQAANVFIIIE